MNEFVNFLLSKVFQSRPIPEKYIDEAFLKTVRDVMYHFPTLTEKDIKERIVSNSNELAVFLFRLGRSLHENNEDELKPQIHWLLKELCCCELYFNNNIGEGFYIIHGEGTIIGSRNTIDKGFKIHQGCTIGHKKNGGGGGNVIGKNVTMYCNSSIIGELNVGNNVVVGAHVMLTKNLPANTIVTTVQQINEKELL